MSDWDDGRNAPGDQKPSVGQLVERLSEQATRLVRSEIALAKAELTTKMQHAGVGIGLFAVAAVIVLYAIGVLIFAAVAGIAEALPWWLSALIVGVAMFLLAGGLAFVGVRQLKRGVPPVPARAVDSIKQDVATIKEGLRP